MNTDEKTHPGQRVRYLALGRVLYQLTKGPDWVMITKPLCPESQSDSQKRYRSCKPAGLKVNRGKIQGTAWVVDPTVKRPACKVAGQRFFSEDAPYVLVR